jgi:hypothetical protein
VSPAPLSFNCPKTLLPGSHSEWSHSLVPQHLHGSAPLVPLGEARSLLPKSDFQAHNGGPCAWVLVATAG